MPFSNFDDLRYLIEDELPQQARAVLAKANLWQENHAERKQHDRRVVLNEIYVNKIVRAMTDTECRSDPDDCGRATSKEWLPRFMLRH